MHGATNIKVEMLLNESEQQLTGFWSQVTLSYDVKPLTPRPQPDLYKGPRIISIFITPESSQYNVCRNVGKYPVSLRGVITIGDSTQ